MTPLSSADKQAIRDSIIDAITGLANEAWQIIEIIEDKDDWSDDRTETMETEAHRQLMEIAAFLETQTP